MNTHHVLISRTLIVTVLFLCAVIAWFSGRSSQVINTPSIASFLEVASSCEIEDAKSPTRLVAYVPTEKLSKELVSKLCQDATVAKQFGGVDVYWGTQLSDSIVFLGKGLADLILAKENLMNAFMAESTHNYRAVMGNPDYTAFLISAKERPRLDKAYFLDKTVGLVEYPTSRSGHILPKRLFKQLDLNIDTMNIVYAGSHTALRELLATGQVDLIASYWKEEDEAQFSRNYITPIQSKISGSKWYLKMENENTDLMCAVQNVLLALAKAQVSPYFNDAEAYQVCQEQGVSSNG